MHLRVHQHRQHHTPRPRRVAALVRVLCRVVQTAIAVGASLGALAVVLAVVASYRPLPLGSWLGVIAQSHVASRLELLGIEAQLGDFEVGLRTGLVPVLAARDIALMRPGETEPLLRFDEAEMVLHRDSLILGLVRPRSLRLSGVRVLAVRDTGAVSLNIGRARILEAVENPGELLAQLQDILDRPSLSRLNELGLSGLDLRMNDRVNGWVWHSRRGDLRISRLGDTLGMTLALSELGEEDPAGALSVRMTADMARETGKVRFALRGLNPVQMLPSEGTDLDLSRMAVDAPVSLDLSAGILPSGELGPLQGQVALGQGSWRLPSGHELTIEGAGARLMLSPSRSHLQISDLVLETDMLGLDGRAQVLGEKDANGALTGLVLQVSLQDLRLNGAGVLAQPLRAETVEAALHLDLRTRRLTLAPSDLVAQGNGLRVEGVIAPPVPGAPTSTDDPVPPASVIQARADATELAAPEKRLLPEGWSMALDVATSGVDSGAALDLWPLIVASKTRGWAHENVRSGRVEDARLSLRLPPMGRPDVGLTFRFADVTAVASDRLPPFEAATGFVSLLDHQVSVHVDTARLPVPSGGAVAISDGLIVKSDTTRPETPLDIQAHARASAGDVVSLVSLPFFSKDDSAGSMPISPDEVSGDLSMDLAVQVPMGPGRAQKKPSFQGAGRLQDVETAALLPGRVLTSPGLEVAIDTQGLRIGGPVALDGMPVHAVWERPMGAGDGSSTVQIEAALTQPLIAGFGVPLRASEMSGAGQVSATVRLRPGLAPSLNLQADLSGARLSLPGIGWSKSAARGGTLEMTGRLGGAPSFERLRLEAPGLLLDGQLRVAAGGGLQSLDLSRARIGSWFDGALQVRPATGKQVALTLNGGRLDLRNLPSGGGGGGQGPVGAVDIALDRIVVGEGMALTDVRGAANLNGGVSGTLRGKVNGAAPVRVQLTPDDYGPRVRIRAADAGAVMRAARLYQRASGGALDMTLTPTGSKGSYMGALSIDDTTIRDAPTAASLLSAISLVGLAEQAGAGGLVFGRVEAEFLLTPERVVVTESSATGPSLGLSLDGTLNLESKTMDMQGVISPFFFVNRVGSGMTRRGEGLLGITFKLGGGFAEPKLRANPLSLLTPGVFREIFRRDPPQVRINGEAQ